jgi:hypothetical protein
MKKLTLISAAGLFLLLAFSSAEAQAYSAESNEGLFGLYNLLEADLGCGPVKNYSGTVSGLQSGEGDGTTIYSFNLSGAGGRRQKLAMLISDEEIAPDEVVDFLVRGRRVRVKARNCDGQMTAVEVVEMR